MRCHIRNGARERFSRTDLFFPSRSFVVIDIDGTLVTDGLDVPDEAAVRAVSRIAENHDACLVSNKNDPGRNARMARLLSIPYVPGKKPYGRAVSALRRMNAGRLPVITVGDRYLTDGLLALRLGGTFVAVRPLRTRNEPFLLRLSYALHESVTAFALAVIPWFRRP